MKKKTRYSATLVKELDHFNVTFRHPIVMDKTGKCGLKIKKGLGCDKDYAERVVIDLNKILSNEEFWKEENLVDTNLNKKSIQIFFEKVNKELLFKYELRTIRSSLNKMSYLLEKEICK